MKVEKEGVTRYVLTKKKREGQLQLLPNFVGWTGGKRKGAGPPLFYFFFFFSFFLFTCKITCKK